MALNTLFFCLLALCTGAVSWGQTALDLQFEHLSTQQGLPSNEINMIYQDNDGYIWMATNSGLCRYDAHTIRVYKSNINTPTALTNNKILCTQEDNKHRLWIGTYNGLNVLDKTTGKIEKIDCENISEQPIHEVLIVGDNEILLCCERNIFRYRPNENLCVGFLQQELEGAFPKALVQDSKGQIWIGTWNKGLFRYDPKEKQAYHYHHPLLGQVYSLYEDRKKRLWVGSWRDGLFKIENPYDMDRYAVEAFPCSGSKPTDMADCYVMDISEDKNTGLLWLGTRNGLSILYDEEKKLFKNFLPDHFKNAISYNTVSTVFRDKTGNMWIGTIGGGVNFVKTAPVLFKQERLADANPQLVQNPTITGILVDNKDLLWLGLSSNGFVVRDRYSGCYKYDIDSEVFSLIGKRPMVTMLYRSPSTNKIWIATYDWGVFCYDPDGPIGHRTTHLNYETCPWLSNLCVYAIFEDPQGYMWFGTRTGICYLTPDGKGVRLNNHSVDNKYLSFFSISSMVCDSTHNIWVATNNGGIIKISGDFSMPESLTYKRFCIENGKLSATSAVSLLIDGKKRLWAGTEGSGLNLYVPTNDVFVPVSPVVDLPGDDVLSIREDSNGDLWLGTNAGLIHFMVADDITRSVYRVFTVSDGLLDNSFYPNSSFVAPDGEMFFGGHHGYNCFYPQHTNDNKYFPPLVISDIKIHHQSWHQLGAEEKSAISAHAPGFTDKITLNYRQNNFSIEFTALDYDNPSQIMYAYKLEGYDIEWQSANTSKRFSYYNNLAPGEYTFHLKATNPNGTWNNKEKTILVTILPPPWKTGWAYLGYLSLIGTLLYLAFYIVRYRFSLINKLKLVVLEQEKTEDLNRAKMQFFTNVTHELRTPLTLIITPLDALLREVDDAKVKTSLSVIFKNAQDLLSLVNQLLDFRRLETMGENLTLSYCNITEYIDGICNQFQYLTKDKGVEFQWECPPDLFAQIDKDKLKKIVNNLLSNAYKFTPQGGSIMLLLGKDTSSHSFFIKISDTGCGIPQEELTSIFNRFYQIPHRDQPNTGSGIGLHLVQEYVKLHNGRLYVDSKVNEGSVFTFFIPMELSSGANESHEAYTTNENQVITHHSSPEILKILIVEDNDQFRTFLSNQLSDHFMITCASNGSEGLVKAMENQPDIIISDVIMPEMTGVEMCNRLKKEIRTSHIPIILLTAKNSDEAQIEGYGAGADAYISKPFNMDILALRINYLLEQQEKRKKLFKKAIFIQPESITITNLDEKLIRDAISYIEKNISNTEYAVEQLSKDLSVDRTNLYRKLKGITGQKPTEFIRSIRLKKSAQLLEKGMPIAEVADMVGFGTLSYFSKCFKEEFGFQPSQYGKNTSIGKE